MKGTSHRSTSEKGFMFVFACIVSIILLSSTLHCSPTTTPKDSGPLDPAKMGLNGVCPGAKGCLKSEGDLMVGASALTISPKNYEVVRNSYLNFSGFCPKPVTKGPFGLIRCGQIVEKGMSSRKDCGSDGLCKDDNVKTKESCDENTKCPTGLTCNTKEKRCYLSYPGADKDGSERDGKPDWFLDCGRDRVCPCQDEKGNPSYYGAKAKTCLTGHKKNPDYKGPDADGSEGNGKFDGIWMGGFEPNHPLQGFHDDLWTRVLVLRTGDVTVAIVSLDLVGFFYDAVVKIREEIAKKLSKEKIDYILVSSTHNHEGPDSMGQWGQYKEGVPGKSGVDPGFFKYVLERSVKAILEAESKLKKAKVVIGQTSTGREGFLRDSRDPKIFDDSMAVLKFTEADSKKTIATLVSWGNHPEVLSDTNNYLTSDYSHYLREGMEKGIPKGKSNEAFSGEGGVSIYLQAAVGCLMTPLRVDVPSLDGTIQNQSGWEKSKALGYQLAAKALAALKKPEEIKNTNLSFWSKQLKLPIENLDFQLAFGLKIFDRKVYDYDEGLPVADDNIPKVQTEIAIIKMGDVTFYSMPGELDPEVLIGGYDGKYSYGIDIISKDNKNPPDLSKAPKGPYLKERIPGKYKIFVGLGNDEIGYLIPSWNYQLHPKAPYVKRAEGNHYEETNSLGPSTYPKLMEAYKDLIKYATPAKK